MKKSLGPSPGRPSPLSIRQQMSKLNQPRQPAIQPKAATPPQQPRPPVAPPVYRPQPVPKVLQRKTVTPQPPPSPQPQRKPCVPPAACRTPPVPKVLQPSMATAPPRPATSQPRQLPARAPVQSPRQEKSIQPRTATAAHKPEAVLPARRPPQNRVLQPKAPVPAQARKTPGPALTARPPLARTFLTVQMKPTFTGLKTEHAKAVYKNHYKGDPPFKPQKGNFGQVSWFAGTGNAYVGGQTQSYTVRVDVDVPDPKQLDKDFFDDFKDDYLQTHPDVDLRDTTTHRAFWTELGRVLEAYGLAEVYVPQGELSRQGAGTFIVANSGARMQVKLTKPEKLRADLEALGVDVDTLEKDIDAKENTHGTSFGVRFNSIKEEEVVQKPNKTLRPLRECVDKIVSDLGQFGVVKPSDVQNLQGGKNPVPVNATFAERAAGTRYWISCELKYATYKIARQQAKLWAAVANYALVRNDYGSVVITKGANWSNTAVRAYTAVY